MRLPYHILDVFTNQRFGGNPLAVVLDADGLDAQRMQTIAREFNLSETVFVLKPQNPAHSARVRIFTPAIEMPFAGHPTVGTAALLAQLKSRGAAGDGDALIVLEEGDRPGPGRGAAAAGRGAVRRVRCPQAAAGERHAAAGGPAGRGARPDPGRDRLREPSPDPVRGRQHVRLRAGGVAGGDGQGARGLLALGGGDSRAASARSSIAGRRCTTRPRSTRACSPPSTACPRTPRPARPPSAFAGVVHRFDALPDGLHKRTIEQGFEMGRPSLIELSLHVGGGKLEAVRIGGHAVRVAEGMIEV